MSADRTKRLVPRVVVAENDPTSARFVLYILEELAGVDARIFLDGDGILDLARSGTVDLFLLDRDLPDTRVSGTPVGGDDLCRLLKADSRTSGVPVVLIASDEGLEAEEALCRSTGADGVWSKPLRHLSRMVSEIRELVARAG